MKPKKCQLCDRIFVSLEKWTAHVTLSPCAQRRQERIAEREEILMRDIEAGKRGWDGRRIRRF